MENVQFRPDIYNTVVIFTFTDTSTTYYYSTWKPFFVLYELIHVRNLKKKKKSLQNGHQIKIYIFGLEWKFQQ